MSETPDIASSTDDYATRFAGPSGAYLLSVQNDGMARLGRQWAGKDVLDVGGGHAQLTGLLLDAGSRVTVLGSDASCFGRIRRRFGTRVHCVEGDLLEPPFGDRRFDLVVSIRMLAHLHDAERFVRGLCRVAREAVIVDYPERRSMNALVPWLFGAKEKLEGNTRSFRLYQGRDLIRWFAGQGFEEPSRFAEFFWPMVLHRKLGRPSVSRAFEALPRAVGLTRLLGSPVLLRVTRIR